ncbi:MAG: hypothetical protein GY811_22560 [Myxococcales bacterium]|nr:hypothetical protein [Myxococcales bacterium]
MGLLAVSILAAVVLGSLLQPRVGGLRLAPHLAATLGAAATLALGLVSPSEALRSMRFMVMPLLTLASLMSMTLVAEKVGLFVSFTRWLARVSKGNAKRLFAYLFFAGTMVGALFTNDAAVLILTPLVGTLLAEISTDGWSPRAKLPYFFAVLYVANLVGLLVISNPINIVVAETFQISFLEYARWMVLPAIASFTVTFAALRFYFRHDLPCHFDFSEKPQEADGHAGFRKLAATIIGFTLVGFFTQGLTNVPLHLIAAAGAAVLLLFYRTEQGGELLPIATGIAWDVILFVVAIFIVAKGVGNAGLTSDLGSLLVELRRSSEAASVSATGGIAAGLSALMNNHPVAYTMSLAIEDMGVEPGATKIHVFAALIGGDLGPKMLPIGSLAALLWFRLLRDRGVHVSYGEYIRLGVPVTLLAVAAAIGVLLLEVAIAG